MAAPIRRLVDWIGGAVWGIALYRLWKRWRGEEPEPQPEPAEEPDGRAEELRAKLAETREAEPETPPPPAKPEQPETLEERRRRVHEEGRAAIDEMQGE